jgi:hypothetical protein
LSTKHLLPALVLLGFALRLTAAANVGPGPAPGAVEQWGLFEAALTGPADGNPFMDVELAADFTDGERTIPVTGFYDGDGTYRVRFMPDRAGAWRYVTRSNRPELAGHRGAFTAMSPGPGNHGPVRVAHTFHFAYADGTPFKQVGTTCYTWTHRTDALEEQTLHTLAASPFNKLRMAVLPQDHGIKFMPPPRFPFAGSPPRAWDTTRFNPDFFRHLEQRIGRLRDLGIECDLILFHPYGKTWDFHGLDATTDDRYVRYVVARLAAYRNIWWSLANEYDFIRSKTEADWDRLFQVVQASDPYGHLRSIHNGNRLYNHTHPWVTHVSLQNGPAVEDPARAELLREVYRKPLVFDEVRYEGDFMRWASLSGRELVHRFWTGTVAGTYVGHSEFFLEANFVTWLGQGGVLKGESPPRLAFLRQVLEDSPPAGIGPIDRWERADLGGQSGEYYLLYFGHATPTEWIFQLPRYRLADGMEFRVEILDTWAMSITSVAGVFVVKTRPPYDFKPGSHDERVSDERDGRRVSLPGRPGLALRIRRTGGPSPLPPADPPVEP